MYLPMSPHERLDRFGIPVGMGMVGGVTVLDWLGDHGMTMLHAAVLIVGLSCTLVTTTMKVLDWMEAKRTRSDTRADVRSEARSDAREEGHAQQRAELLAEVRPDVLGVVRSENHP